MTKRRDSEAERFACLLDIATRWTPDDEELIEALRDHRLPRHRAPLLGMLGDELLASGMDADLVPNDYGDEIEGLIDFVQTHDDASRLD